MELGVIIGSEEAEFAKTEELGISTCQLWMYCTAENLNEDHANRILKYSEKYNVRITAQWCCWPGIAIWNFYEGPLTLGLVPISSRWERTNSMKLGSDFAKKIGVTDIITHVGFLPENPMSTEYHEMIIVLREIAEHCAKNEQYFLFETGQETPVTLLRTIEEVGTGNLGINLDPANLILYGKGNPVDALEVFGKYVRGIHGKDGLYPTDGRMLGREVPIGQGKVDYPLFIKKLKEIGFDGAITIEREISGEQQVKDIIAAKKYLTHLLGEENGG